MLVPGDPRIASALRRASLGAGAALIMALVLALAAVLELIEPEVAVEGCAALAALVVAFYAVLRSGRTLGYPDPSLATAQLGIVFLLLAYLTYRSEDPPGAVAVLYLVAMLYGVLRLAPARLYALAALALVAHGTALFMLIDHGHRLAQAAVWTQFGALALALGWFAFAAGIVHRLRGRLAEARRSLHELAEKARDQASRDALTGAYHRRHLLEALEREAARADRAGKPLCVARLDLDRFRSVNETFGHAAGDGVLARFAGVAQRVIRDVDVFGRYGGKEFLLVMPDTDLAGALIAGDRLRTEVELERFPEVGAARRITCSCGLAQYRKAEDLSRLLARAEAGLNYAMAAGRNRVIALGDDGRAVLAEPRAA